MQYIDNIKTNIALTNTINQAILVLTVHKRFIKKYISDMNNKNTKYFEA